MADKKYLDGDGVAQVWQATKDYVAAHSPTVSPAADALTGADSTAQWAQRTTEGSGAATVRSVQGASVVWNQLNRNALYTGTTSGVTFTNNGDGSWTLSGTATGDANKILDVISCPADHKLLLKGCIGGSISTYYMGIGGTITDVGSGGIVTSGATNNLRVDFKSGVSFGDGVTIYPQVFDLTQMFGSGNEPQSVAEFERMYPEAYYPYSAPTLKPVQIAGIRSTDAQGAELDAIEWTAQELWGAGTAGDVLYADHIDVNVGAYTFGDNTPIVVGDWKPYEGTYAVGLSATLFPKAVGNNVRMLELDTLPYASVGDGHQIGLCGNNTVTTQYSVFIRVPNTVASTGAEMRAWLNGKTLYYELATPTTTPISPALPMTYRVQQGGSESIIVPDGEVSAAPIITVAEGESAAELVMDALACIATPDGPVATANHAINTYLTYNGKLYKVTSAIAVGETITPNTNVSETTVMAELIARTA